ncbi:sensor histidine kinase [Sinomonas sp. ASV322]|uniref:sensor histidine kinase n=1 Tax=Sinomonas sp. ASV322 TaxID=3041920 RepID=UPI0027DC50CF|nr:sensor histidine kinase [Sinomonas sp. ASV322]MDQ4502789.1 sensor histidine kinase [Sinomonas sp. ASV322]
MTTGPAIERSGTPRAGEIFGQDLSGRGFLGVLQARAARRWFVGAGVAVAVWTAGNWTHFAATALAAGQLPLRVAHLALFMLGFLLVPPYSWGSSLSRKIALLAGLVALSLGFFLYDPQSGWYWTFVAVAAGLQQLPRSFFVGFVAALFVASFSIELARGLSFVEAVGQPALIVSIGLLLAALGRQAQTLRELRAAQDELAELAVAEERNRVARDLHDILGHSLTVIAVKAELAGRLVRLDPDRAEREVADLEELARGALADVRATVHGYRGVSVATELAEARASLGSAGVAARLPTAADSVSAAHRELFGWVLREGVTNVVRHSGASACEVAMGEDWIQIDDDGVGPERGGGTTPGHGLDGLAERAKAAGLVLSVGRSDLGGFRLRVSA